MIGKGVNPKRHLTREPQVTIQFVQVKVVVGVIYTVVSVSVEAIVFSIILVVRYTFDLSLWILVAKVTQSSFRMIVSSLSYLQFFLRGFCKDGSACKFLHARDKEAPMRQALSSNEKKNSPKEMDGEEPMRQVISSLWLLLFFIQM